MVYFNDLMLRFIKYSSFCHYQVQQIISCRYTMYIIIFIWMGSVINIGFFFYLPAASCSKKSFKVAKRLFALSSIVYHLWENLFIIKGLNEVLRI